jgi:hypothetical protein
MKKILVDITSYVGISGDAEHYYAKVTEVETDRNIYDLVRHPPRKAESYDFVRTLESEVECKQLTQKDGGKSAYRYRIGNETQRFNSVEQVKEWVEKEFPKNDIGYTFEGTLESEDRDVIERNPVPVKLIGTQIKIQNFHGFSPEFKNLTEGSIHEVVETPERYIGTETLAGVWVMGVTEPVKVLHDEYINF